MDVFRNPNRIREIGAEQALRRAIDAVAAYRSREVLLTLLCGWGVFLGMVFTLVLTLRLVLSLPLPWNG